jgi:hypothetical protein
MTVQSHFKIWTQIHQRSTNPTLSPNFGFSFISMISNPWHLPQCFEYMAPINMPQCFQSELWNRTVSNTTKAAATAK